MALVIVPFLDLAQGPHKKKALGAQGTAERKNPAGGALPADLPGFASTESLCVGSAFSQGFLSIQYLPLP